MKKLFVLLYTMGVTLICTAQSKPVEILVTKTELKPNITNDNFSLTLIFTIDIKDSEAIDDEAFVKAASAIKVKLALDNKIAACPLNVEPAVSINTFDLKLSGFSPAAISLLKNNSDEISIILETDIPIEITDTKNDAQKRKGFIKKETLNKLIKDNLKINDEQETRYLSALKNIYYYENKADFGIQPKGENDKTGYYLSLKVQNRYNTKDVLRCDNKVKANTSSIYWSLDTRVSTEAGDSLNFINFYPVNIVSTLRETFPQQWGLKIGNESNQTFSNKRVVIDGSFKAVIPNLVNLTTASSNRLRLKPLIDFGLKFYYDYSRDIKHFSSGQIYLNGYYYIPVYTNYALIFEGRSFYDFSTERNPDKKIMGNYSITFGAVIPKTGFKAMFKYVDGKTDIGFKDGKMVTLGLLMDFLKEPSTEPKPR